jgi:hypothetical protein
MDEKHIEKVKQLLTDWNPLGERAKQITDLGNYETEAIDNKIMVQVLSEAFNLEIDLDVSRKYAEMIRKIIIEK